MKASKTASLVFLIVLSLCLANAQPVKPQSSGTIYIRADGSVEGTDKIQRDGHTYTLTDNINGSIVVERDNIVVDGAGYTLQGTGSGKGIEFSGRKNVTVKNFDIKHFYTGIYLGVNSDNNIISGNNITNNSEGIFLKSSHFNVLRNNMMVDNEQNFVVRGWGTGDFLNDVDTSNTVNGKPVYYWVEEQDKTVPSDAGYVALTRCTNITVQNLNLTNNGQGILLTSTTDSTITKNTITNNGEGIYLWGSSNNTIYDNNIIANNGSILIFGSWPTYSSNNSFVRNNITNNVVGISLFQSSNNVFRKNRMVDNEQNFVVFSLGELSCFIHDVDASNTVNGKPMYYLVNRQNMEVPSDAGYVTLVNCTGITVRNLTLANDEQGILLAKTTNSTITTNIMKNNNNGVLLWSSFNNTLSGNDIANNDMGIKLEDSSNNSIHGNYIANNANGIYCGGGVPFRNCKNNIVYHNSFINNTKQVDDIHWEFPFSAPSLNRWDNGVEGNYWSDYEERYPNATEIDNSGIWDTPYVLDEHNQDNHPLMHPWDTQTPQDTTPPTISIISPENKTYTANNVSLTFTVNELTSWIGYSLDGQANVTVTRNTTLSGLSYGSHNLIVYANDTDGNTGTSETIYFTIAQQSEPFPTTWIAATIIIVTIAVVGAALLVYFGKMKKTTVKTETPAMLAQGENWVDFTHE